VCGAAEVLVTFSKLSSWLVLKGEFEFGKSSSIPTSLDALTTVGTAAPVWTLEPAPS
jgi:hypothetical protein